MKLNRAAWLLLIFVPILLIAGGTASYFAYQKMQAQHQRNVAELEQFGYEMVPSDIHSETVGTLGASQLPSTFSEKKLTPTERVIRGLMQDKENLLAEQQTMLDEIDAQKQQIEELKDYKRLNQHFAPESFADELARTKSVLKSTLARMPESEPFSNVRLDVMAAAGTQEYRRFVMANRLILDRPEKARIIEDYLPTYAFCVARAVDLAANSRDEERILMAWFSDPDQTRLPTLLAADIDKLLPACKTPLRTALQATLPTP
ncbi:MAG: hypothetical protein GYB41_14945 [Oceanospirillales bacterium]|nr:hypothetical protein [Oceanospirillales bacterium]